MPRIVKDPEERRREIQDAAMELFVQRGYDEVSMRDIAKAAGVTAGLAYHYFDSKQKLFASALDDYAAACVEEAVRVLDSGALTFDEKMDALFESFSREEAFSYRAFFHAEGNRAFHDRLSFRICERMYPHLLAAINAEARRRGKTVREPETLASFLLFGNVGIMARCHVSAGAAAAVRSYAGVLMDSQME